MSECKHECVILKRICIFILGVVIGFAGGYKYGFSERTVRTHDRLMKQAEKPLFKRYGKQPEPFEKGLFDKREKREELRERMKEKKTPKERIPR
mgnify:FL=1